MCAVPPSLAALLCISSTPQTGPASLWRYGALCLCRCCGCVTRCGCLQSCRPRGCGMTPFSPPPLFPPPQLLRSPRTASTTCASTEQVWLLSVRRLLDCLLASVDWGGPWPVRDRHCFFLPPHLVRSPELHHPVAQDHRGGPAGRPEVCAWGGKAWGSLAWGCIAWGCIAWGCIACVAEFQSL
jgi:hypothetical protein